MNCGGPISQKSKNPSLISSVFNLYKSPSIDLLPKRTQTNTNNKMLPYHTLEEAEEALGRGSTLAEKTWLKYTAQKPDYILHCHNTLFLFLFYSILPLPYLFIELCLSNNFRKYKIQPNIKSSFSDMFKCYKDVMLTFVLSVGPLQVLSYPTFKVCFFGLFYFIYFFLFELL